MKKIFLFLLMPFVLGCDNIVDETNTEADFITLKNTEEYRLDLTISGDEEGAVIKTQAKNHEISELVRNAATNWRVVYYYKPKAGFMGTDSVEIETCTGGASTGCTNIDIVKLKFNVVGN